MNGNQGKEAFNYTYSSKEQKEIEKIRKKYLPADQHENKLDAIRRLDASVTHTSMSWALVLGIIGSLIMGTGMGIVMTELGEYLGLVGVVGYAVGISVGALGAVIAGIAYPVYSAILKKKRAKVAPEILRLTDELLKK